MARTSPQKRGFSEALLRDFRKSSRFCLRVDCDGLARSLASTGNFVKAVQSQDVKMAAESAVDALLKVSGLLFAMKCLVFPKVLPPLASGHGELDAPPSKKLLRKSSMPHKEGITIGARMVVRAGHKRTPGELVGTEVLVLSQEPGGWTQCKRCDTDAIVRIHSKCLSAIPDLDAETQESVQQIRKQMLDLEEFIPWNGVSRSWKSRRPGWRKTVRGAERVAELADRLKDLLTSLVWEKSWKIAHGGRTWENDVDAIAKGKCDQKKFWNLWETIAREIRRWIQERDHIPQPFSVQMPPHKTARIALSALEDAAPHGKEGIEQVPMEAITSFDIQGLQHLKMLLLQNRTELCEVLERVADPSLALIDKEHLLAACEKRLMTFPGPRDCMSELCWVGDRSITDDGAMTDSSDYAM